MKKNIKKTLKIAGILFIVLSIIQMFVLGMRIYSMQAGISKIKFTWFDYTIDAVEIALSLITGIIYLSQLSKQQDDIVKQNKLFFGLCMVNVLNSLAGWVISFWVQISVEQAKTKEYSFVSPFQDASSQKQNENNITEDGNIIMDDSSYEVLHTETLTSRLQELDHLRNKNLISQEEYTRLRQEAIDKFLN